MLEKECVSYPRMGAWLAAGRQYASMGNVVFMVRVQFNLVVNACKQCSPKYLCTYTVFGMKFVALDNYITREHTCILLCFDRTSRGQLQIVSAFCHHPLIFVCSSFEKVLCLHHIIVISFQVRHIITHIHTLKRLRLRLAAFQFFLQPDLV